MAFIVKTFISKISIFSEEYKQKKFFALNLCFLNQNFFKVLFH